jgi:hypothetical protein
MRKNGPAARFAAASKCEKKTKSHAYWRQRAWLFSFQKRFASKKVCIKNCLHQKLFAELLRGFGHYSENGGTIVKTPIILTVNNRIMDKNTVIKFKDLLFDFILLKLNTCYTLLYIY